MLVNFVTLFVVMVTVLLWSAAIAPATFRIPLSAPPVAAVTYTEPFFKWVTL